jgi:hypothetical protein
MTQLGDFQRRRPLRGRPYTLEEFASKYRLAKQAAEDLYLRFGPSQIELDLLMAAKRHVPELPERLAE